MPAKDIYHDSCKQALIKDGWHISHDPYNLKLGGKTCSLIWQVKN